ncbi:MAG: YfiH family protein [Paracoccaceae bacterium]|jgi:YfiH family protein
MTETAMSLSPLTSEWLDQVRHGFFTREGGVSTSVYGSLNCGPGSSDAPEAVAENRARVAEAMGVLPGMLLSVRQIHSPTVATIDAPWADADRPEADAMVTKTGGIALCILTADCAPVLFHDPKAGVIGAAHAGWRGAEAGVLEATVDAMEALGAKRAQIAAAIGPCISQRAYEVGMDFMERFTDDDPEHAQFFTMGPRGKPLFDLPSYCLRRLRDVGVDEAGWMRRCTYEDRQRFYSYRRSVHRDERDYGRLASCIMLPRYA